MLLRFFLAGLCAEGEDEMKKKERKVPHDVLSFT